LPTIADAADKTEQKAATNMSRNWTYNNNGRNDQQLRAADMIMNLKQKIDALGPGPSKARASLSPEPRNAAGEIYDEDMFGEKKYNFKSRFSRSPFAQRIPDNWEASPLNDRAYYNKSPAVRHSEKRGDFSPDKFMTRTFNRKLRMKDSFTRILPAYNHQPSSCYTNAASHILHP
jgi:hypothetical protein